jgi:uncharacterized protein (DUF2062 family)
MIRYFQRRVSAPVLDLLKQGAAPEKIALSIAWGAVLGIFPVLGITTFLCAGVAVAFRLNMAAIQLSNWLVYPLQIILIVPFIVLGGHLFGAPDAAGDVENVMTLFRADLSSALGYAGERVFRAILVWLLAVPVVFPLLNKLLVSALRKVLEERA